MSKLTCFGASSGGFSIEI